MLRLESSSLKQTVEKKEKKITFLEKLLIEKDNGEHAARKKMKKIEK